MSPVFLCCHSPNRMNTNRTNSLMETHTFLVTLIRRFDLSLPDDGREVWKMNSGLITPVVVGEEHEGPQLWLKVAALKDE